MWNVKTEVIPVILEVTGTISKSFRKYLSNTTGKHEIIELRKTAILGTAHIRGAAQHFQEFARNNMNNMNTYFKS